MTNPPTHSDLVRLAVSWLKRKERACLLVASNVGVRNGGPHEIVDAIGISYRDTWLVECKASRSDYLRDRKKKARENGDRALGTHRLYLAPREIISPAELPEKWGLIEVRPRSVIQVWAPGRWEKTPQMIEHERYLMMGLNYRLAWLNDRMRSRLKATGGWSPLWDDTRGNRIDTGALSLGAKQLAMMGDVHVPALPPEMTLPPRAEILKQVQDEMLRQDETVGASPAQAVPS